MSDIPRRKIKKKNRKHGRNAVSCKNYQLTHRREKNKARRLRKHLDRFPFDKVAQAALRACEI